MSHNSDMQYVHKREKSEKNLKNAKAIATVRTDSAALTLDRFLNKSHRENQINSLL
jgi:hypothetical protein